MAMKELSAVHTNTTIPSSNVSYVWFFLQSTDISGVTQGWVVSVKSKLLGTVKIFTGCRPFLSP